MRKINLFFTLVIVALMLGCGKTDGNYLKTKSGLEYRFYVNNKDAEKPEIGNVLKVNMSYAYHDSILYRSSEHVNNLRIILKDFRGSLHEGMSMMHKGDSASFLLPVDSVLSLLGFSSLPKEIDKNEKVSINLKLIDFMTQEDLQKEINALKETKKKQADQLLDDYIKENNIKCKPMPSGLYYKESKKGFGNKPKKGDMAQIHYVAKYLNGIVFDNCSDTLINIVIGDNQIFSGMEEGIIQMHKKGKATLIIPYNLAFGEDGNELVPPYTSLVIDIELVNIIDSKTVKIEKEIEAEKAVANAKIEFDKYLIDNNLVNNQVFEGLTYTKVKEGKGNRPVKGSKVKVHYVGKLIDGTIFDSSYDRNQPFEFELGKGGVLPGWDMAVSLMTEGEKSSFVMSQSLAYRDYSLGVIKPYSNLIYEIELIDVQ